MSEKSTVERQLQREQQEQARSQQAGALSEARLRAQCRLAATAAGRKLFEQHAELLTVALGGLLEELLEDPSKPGPHHAAWPLLLAATCRGPRSIASIALSVVIDGLHQGRERVALAKAIGTALQDEMRAGRIEQQDADLARLIARKCGPRALARPEVLNAVRADPEGWTAGDRGEVGGLVLEVIRRSLDLVEVVPAGTKTMVRATESARALLASRPPLPLPLRRFPMLVPPRPWTGMTGGGHLGNTDPLVRSRAGLALQHLTPGTMAPLLAAVNHLQAQALRVNREMVALQREAWDKGIPGLFPVRPQPAEAPPRPTEKVGADAMRRWRLAQAEAQQDRHEGGPQRTRIEETLRQCEALAGESIWLAHCADFRGRLYTANRFVTHQGPDWEKAVIEFAGGAPAGGGPDDLAALRQAAAAHFGVRGTGQELEAWALGHRETMASLAADPLAGLDWWRGAKDPWQFLQCCRAIAGANHGAPLVAPVRYDQCCSGAAIVAGLMRDARLARLCNLTGTDRSDLYGHLAELLIHRLQGDLQMGTAREQRLADVWLAIGLDRSMLKPPTMAALYGGSWIGLVEMLALRLQEIDPRTMAQWRAAHISPAKYLAAHLRALFKEELASVHRLNEWLRATSRRVLSTGRPLQWTTPAGMLIRLGQAHDARSSVTTLTRGRRRWRGLDDHALEGELSARATNASLLPNVIHSFDASFCQQVVCAAAARGVPIVTNHDCFATTPAHAAWLRWQLDSRIRAVFKEDHLARMAAEIADAAKVSGIRPPVPTGTLDPEAVGSNPYHFC